jgi:hypothetical protein
MADGRAFVTEYAGTSDVVSQFGIQRNLGRRRRTSASTPIEVINVGSTPRASRSAERVRVHVEPPAGLRAAARVPAAAGRRRAAPVLWRTSPSYVPDIDEAKWNMGAGFSAALLDRVIDPGSARGRPARHVAVPDAHVHDDLAGRDDGGPDLPLEPRPRGRAQHAGRQQLHAVQRRQRGHAAGRRARSTCRAAFTWPDIPGELWWEEEVQTIALKGAPMTLVNNTAAITKVLTEWNLTHGWPRDLATPRPAQRRRPAAARSGASEASGDGPPLEVASPAAGCRSQDVAVGLSLLSACSGCALVAACW